MAIGAALFALAFVYRFFDSAKLVNDHFMHVVWGRQVLMGRSPVRDMVGLGLPLQSALSAWAESLVGYRLVSEAIVISTAFAIGALLTFVLARRLSGSTPLAVMAALLEIAVTPRTYSYPKIVVYAFGLLVCWRYIEKPSRRAAAYVAAAIVAAFFLRHDHGVYLALIATITLWLCHWNELGTAIRRTAIVGIIGFVAVAPYFIYVQASGGIVPWLRNLQQFAQREFQGDPWVWPQWPLSSLDSVVKTTSGADQFARIKIRWRPDSSVDSRHAAVVRHKLQIPDDGNLDSGTFLLTDLTRANVLELLRDDVVEDTAGINRVTGDVALQGFRVGGLQLLTGLDSVEEAAALLFYVFLAVIALTSGALVLAFDALRTSERLNVAVTLATALITVTMLVRDPLPARVGDAIVAPIILAAWLCARWLRHGGSWPRRGAMGMSALAVLVIVTRSVLVTGSVIPRLEGTQVNRTTLRALTSSPPFDGWQAVGSAKYRIVRYVRSCTERSDPLLVLWFAPELYYYSDRPFAGRFGFYIDGYWSADDEQRRNIAAIERDRPPLAIIEAGRERIDLPSHPRVLAYLNEFYHPIGELATTADTILRVFARNDRTPTSVDADLGWPCFREEKDEDAPHSVG